MSDRDDIIAAANAGTLPELFLERLRRHRTDELGKAFRATLIKLHDDGTIDVLEPARQIATSPINQHDFFAVMLVYTELMPMLDASVTEMMAAVKALSSRAGEDLTSGMPNGAYRSWAEQGSRARDTLETINPEDGDDSAYIFLALQALAKTETDAALDRAIIYVGGNAGPARSAAAKAIGTFDVNDPERRVRAISALTANASSADDNSLGHILAAICEVAKAHPDTRIKAAALIDANIERTGDHAIHQLSLELMFHADELPPAIVKPLTAIMHRVPIGNRGTIRDIGAAAGKLADKNRLNEALALITPLLSQHEELTSLEPLGSLNYHLLQLPPDELAQTIIIWLLACDPNLGRATIALIGDYHGDAPLILDPRSAAASLDDPERLLLAHRAIGWLFVHPVTAASLVVGLLDGAGDAAQRTIAELLFDPLLINFSKSVGDWIAEQAKAPCHPSQTILNDLVTRLEAYIDGLRTPGRIKELRPSEPERPARGRRALLGEDRPRWVSDHEMRGLAEALDQSAEDRPGMADAALVPVLEDLELQARRARVEDEEGRDHRLDLRSSPRFAPGRGEQGCDRAGGKTRRARVGTARQDDRHARAQHDAGRVGVRQEGQALRQHVAGLEVGHHEHVGATGHRRRDPLHPGGAQIDRVVEGERPVAARRLPAAREAHPLRPRAYSRARGARPRRGGRAGRRARRSGGSRYGAWWTPEKGERCEARKRWMHSWAFAPIGKAG